MMTLDEAAEKYAEIYRDLTKSDKNSTNLRKLSMVGFKTGAEFAQRWISVEEGFPKTIPFLGKDKYGKIELFNVMEESFIKAIDITHWRPIKFE